MFLNFEGVCGAVQDAVVEQSETGGSALLQHPELYNMANLQMLMLYGTKGWEILHSTRRMPVHNWKGVEITVGDLTYRVRTHFSPDDYFRNDQGYQELKEGSKPCAVVMSRKTDRYSVERLLRTEFIERFDIDPLRVMVSRLREVEEYHNLDPFVREWRESGQMARDWNCSFLRPQF